MDLNVMQQEIAHYDQFLLLTHCLEMGKAYCWYQFTGSGILFLDRVYNGVWIAVLENMEGLQNIYKQETTQTGRYRL